ncbi:MAG: thiol:disulfide interchange protein DsbA/DsbL [Betaproteobacteria bacterium]
MKLLKHLAVAALLGAGLAHAANPAPVLDKEYKIINPAIPTDAPGKVEVLEFFQYTCGHCYDFEPFVKTWKAKKPKDVVWRYVPTVWDASRIPQAKIFYTLEAMGLLDQLHDKVYDAIHQKGLLLTERAVLSKWIAAQPGVDAKKFEETYDSFGVDNKVQRATQMTKTYLIKGTPTVIVNGKYSTGPGNAINASGRVDYERFGQILDDLVAMEQKKK